MSIKQLAEAVRAQGRGEDTVLIHMTPGEVGGLQGLARAHGGSLTINPSTGLPEAGFLSNILPTILGAGVGIMTGNPLLGAAAAGATGMAANKGSLQAGLMAGLGAYGLGGIGTSMMAAGAAPALSSVSAAGSSGLAGLGQAGGATLNATMGGAGAMSQPALAASVPQLSTAQQLAAGWEAVSKAPMGFLKSNAANLGMAGMGLMSSTPKEPEKPSSGMIRPYTASQTRNPEWGNPGQPYFNQSITAGEPVPADEWGDRPVFRGGGIVALAEGGRAADVINRYSQPAPAPAGASPAANYMRQNPDVALEFASGRTGMTDPNQYAQFHYGQYGQNEGRAAPAGTGAPSNLPPMLAQLYEQDAIRANAEYLAQPQLAPMRITPPGTNLAPNIPAPTTTMPTPQLLDLEKKWDDFEKRMAERDNAMPYDVGGAKNGGLIRKYAQGGGIAALAGSGRLLEGPGDGVSDSIPATIEGQEPAALADGEFVIPARIVSELGNGSTDAGARRLYAMIERIQNARRKTTGKDDVAVDSRAYGHLPA